MYLPFQALDTNLLCSRKCFDIIDSTESMFVGEELFKNSERCYCCFSVPSKYEDVTDEGIKALKL